MNMTTKFRWIYASQVVNGFQANNDVKVKAGKIKVVHFRCGGPRLYKAGINLVIGQRL